VKPILLLLAFAAVVRADVKVDADFPGGNIVVQRVEGDTVYVAPDLRDTQKGQWWFYWNFRLRAPAEQPVTIVFTDKNPISVRGPAVSTDNGVTWRWLGAAAVKSGKHDGKSSWSFTAQVPAGATEVRYALCPQYLESHLRSWLDTHSTARVEELCKSLKGRRVELVRAGKGKDVVLLTSRHHCCEAMATYVMEGFLEASLTNNWETIAVPFMDKDGVEAGDQGKNRAPHDHNRDYNETPLYPEVAALMKLGASLSNRVVAAFDLHCPTLRGEWNDRVYLVGAPEPERWQQQQAFAATLERVREGSIRFRGKDCIPFGKGWNTGNNFKQGRSNSAWTRETFPNARIATTIEIAYADALGDEVNATSARAFGRDMARALAEYLKANPK
jgi:hypothetical protein